MTELVFSFWLAFCGPDAGVRAAQGLQLATFSRDVTDAVRKQRAAKQNPRPKEKTR